MWGVAVAAYALGVFHRSSLAVAGLHATERFGLTGSQLASFVVLQLVVYAAAQVPMGILVDRVGPRRVLLGGVLVMSVGQAVFALADSYAGVLAARAVVALGEAASLVCVLRLIPAWFPSVRVPLLTQATGPVGQLGAVAATAPTVWSLRHLGWEATYLTSAVAGLAVVVALVVVVGDEPARRVRTGTPLAWAGIRRSIRESWARPGTRLGFWLHFTHHFSPSVLGLLWGYPFLVIGQGLSEEVAGLLLSLMMLTIVVAGPVTGWWTGGRPSLQVTYAVGCTGGLAAVWAAVLAWPGDAPIGLLVGLMVAAGVAGPCALLGFEAARWRSPSSTLGLTNALVNCGGFLASLLAVLAVGVVLDVSGGSGPDGPTALHLDVAMTVQFVLWGLGFVQVRRQWRRCSVGAAS
ncbi:MFS transporter [Nocardioides sp. IC4_145]|nr:MFS transporter [Nocardioides sp. IC4_145]